MISYDGKINKNFHDNKIPRECFHCNFKLVIVNDFALKKGEYYYQQGPLRECNMK